VSLHGWQQHKVANNGKHGALLLFHSGFSVFILLTICVFQQYKGNLLLCFHGNNGYTSKAQRCGAILIVTEEFAVDLGCCLLWGKPIFSCLLPVTNVFQLIIKWTEVQSCFVLAR
jgi:hypothetical protein